MADLDEYGAPVAPLYERLGASDVETGVYVRFEPGFGLNVHIGHRYKGTQPSSQSFTNEIVFSGVGWDRLCQLVDEWRARDTGREPGEIDHPDDDAAPTKNGSPGGES